LGPDLTGGLLYGYADDALDQASDELDLAFGEDEAKVITDAEAAGINAYLEAAKRILKAALSPQSTGRPRIAEAIVKLTERTPVKCTGF
jgi:hypothetical protein